MIRLSFIKVLVAVICTHALSATSQSIQLSPDTLFRIIDDRNRSIRLSELATQEAAEAEKAAFAERLPILDASVSVAYLGNGYLTDRNFSNGMAVHNPHANNNFALEALQVLYSGGYISGNIHMARLNRRMANLNVEENRQQIRFLLLGWLIDLHCLHNREHVINENIDLARHILEDMHARFEEGVVLRSDITRYELQLENLQLQQERTRQAIRTTDYKLANALDYPAGETSFMPQLQVRNDSAAIGPMEEWIHKAHLNNLSLKKAEIQIDMDRTATHIAGADMRPHISLFAYGRFDSPIVTEVPVLNKNFMYWGFGASISFKISSFYATRHRVSQAKVKEMESHQEYEIQIENTDNEIKDAYESYGIALTELRTQRKSRELALLNYSIVKERYDNGMALVTDLVDASNMRLDAELGIENALASILFCYYRLKFITNNL